MKKNNLNIVKIDKNKSLFNYEKKILIKELILDLKLGYYDFEKEKPQKVKFSLEIDYEDKKPTSDKDIKSIVNYGQVVKLITKLTKNKHYNFLETLAEDVFDVLFKDKRIGKIMLKIEKLEIIKECASVGIQITKKRSHLLGPYHFFLDIFLDACNSYIYIPLQNYYLQIYCAMNHYPF